MGRKFWRGLFLGLGALAILLFPKAARAAIEHAFAAGAHRIYAECDPENEPSWRLLEALGFAREAHFRKNIFIFAGRSYSAYNFGFSQFSVPPCGSISKNQPIILYYENNEKASVGNVSYGKE